MGRRFRLHLQNYMGSNNKIAILSHDGRLSLLNEDKGEWKHNRWHSNTSLWGFTSAARPTHTGNGNACAYGGGYYNGCDDEEEYAEYWRNQAANRRNGTSKPGFSSTQNAGPIKPKTPTGQVIWPKDRDEKKAKDHPERGQIISSVIRDGERVTKYRQPNGRECEVITPVRDELGVVVPSVSTDPPSSKNKAIAEAYRVRHQLGKEQKGKPPPYIEKRFAPPFSREATYTWIKDRFDEHGCLIDKEGKEVRNEANQIIWASDLVSMSMHQHDMDVHEMYGLLLITEVLEIEKTLTHYTGEGLK
jgi:hypothetical protein